MQSNKFTSTLFFLTIHLFYTLSGLAKAAGGPADPDEWVLGNYLLVGALSIIVIGFLAGGYALLFSSVGPVIKRFFIYPLFKVRGRNGDKKPLVTKK